MMTPRGVVCGLVLGHYSSVSLYEHLSIRRIPLCMLWTQTPPPLAGRFSIHIMSLFMRVCPTRFYQE